MAPTHDPPWRLDPLQNIVNVGWGAGAVLEIDISAGNAFGAPSGLGYDGIPPGVNYTYPFVSKLKQRDPRSTKDIEGGNPPTQAMYGALLAWGDGSSTAIDGSATIFISLKDKNFSVTVHLPASQPGRPGEPTTYYDGFFEITVFYFDGTHGSGNGGFEHATQAEVDAIRADVNGSNDIATWTGSVTITNTTVEAGDPIKNRSGHGMNVAAKKFKGKNPDGSQKYENLPIDGPTSFGEVTTSDAPYGAKDFTIKYDAKTKKISVS